MKRIIVAQAGRAPKRKSSCNLQQFVGAAHLESLPAKLLHFFGNQIAHLAGRCGGHALRALGADTMRGHTHPLTEHHRSLPKRSSPHPACAPCQQYCFLFDLVRGSFRLINSHPSANQNGTQPKNTPRLMNLHVATISPLIDLLFIESRSGTIAD